VSIIGPCEKPIGLRRMFRAPVASTRKTLQTYFMVPARWKEDIDEINYKKNMKNIPLIPPDSCVAALTIFSFKL
jgi:hypothetical protein